MSNPRILVLVGTPIAGSFNHALAEAYAAAATNAGAEVKVVDLAQEPIPAHPSTRSELRTSRNPQDAPLDPHAAASIEHLDWSDHLVIFYPQWWGTYPAALKSWIDRVFLAGTVFRYATKGRGWKKLAAGRTARIVMTMDSPRWWNQLAYHDAAVRTLKTATLGYSGIRTVGVSRIGEVRHRDHASLSRTIQHMGALAIADAARAPKGSKLPLPQVATA